MENLLAKVTSKGQVTLPKKLRDSLSIRTGDRLEFTRDRNDRFTVRKKRSPGSSAGCARKFLHPGQKPLTTDEIDEAIGNHLREKYGDHRKAK